MSRVPMPEASVDPDGQPELGENQVWVASRRQRPVQPEPEAPTMQLASEGQFGLGVLRTSPPEMPSLLGASPSLHATAPSRSANGGRRC